MDQNTNLPSNSKRITNKSFIIFSIASLLVIFAFLLGMVIGRNQISVRLSNQIETHQPTHLPIRSISPTMYPSYSPQQDRKQFYIFTDFPDLNSIPFEKLYIEQPIKVVIDRQPQLSEESHNIFIAHVYTEAISSSQVDKEEIIKIARSILNIDTDPSYFEEFKLAILPYSSKETIGNSWNEHIGTTPIAWYDYNTVINKANCKGTEVVEIYKNGIISNDTHADEIICIPYYYSHR